VRCYGYDESGTQIVEPEAVELRESARRLLAGESIRSVVADLRARKVPTSAGGQWTHHSLSRLLRNPRLVALRTRKGGAVVKATWPAILDKNTHRKLVKLLSDPERGSPQGTNVRKYLLSGGFLECGYPLDDEGHTCGHQLYSQPSNSGKRGYVCRKGSPSYGCGRIRIAADSLEEEVATRALARLASPRVRERLERSIGDMADDSQLTKALTAIDERLVEAGKNYAGGRQISMVTLRAIEREAQEEKKSLLERAAQAKRLKSLPATTPEALAAWWVDAPLERRRELLALVLQKVIIRPATRLGYIDLDIDRLEFVWK
jgi:hypothetical protein